MKEKRFLQTVMDWWNEIQVEGRAGHRLMVKLKLLKIKLKEWAREKFGDVGMQKTTILEEIQLIDNREEMGQPSYEDFVRRLNLKEDLCRKVREEEIKWKQRSRCKWLKGDKNTKLFHGMASARRRKNIILSLMDGRRG